MKLRSVKASDRRTTHRWLMDTESQTWLGGYEPSLHFDFFHQPPDRFVLMACEGKRPLVLLDIIADKERPGVAHISVLVAPEARGQGKGVEALEMVCRDTGICERFTHMHGWVEPNHVVSQRMLRAAGFEPTGETEHDVWDLWERPLVNLLASL